MKHSLSREEGQSVVLITLLMIGLVAMLGLVFDGGNAYLQRRRMQNSADAATFAGAKMLALAPDSSATTECAIRVAIETYAKANGTPGPNPDPSCQSLNSNVKAYFIDGSGNQVGGGEIGRNGGVPAGAKGVHVIPSISFNTFFLGVVNETLGAANAGAAGIYGSVKSPHSLQPLAVQCSQSSLSSCFTYGQSHDIFDGGGPGNFGWLSWGGANNAPYLDDELDPDKDTLSGYDDPEATHCTTIAVSCWVQGEPGVKDSQSIRAQLDGWITRGQAGTPMVIIIWDTSTGNGSNTDYHIVGFAAFILQGYDLPHGSVTGKFIRFVTPDEFCYTGCMDTGLRTTILTQ